MKSIVVCVLIAGIIMFYLLGGSKGFSYSDTDSAGVSTTAGSQKIGVQKTWNLPEALREISGLVHIGDDRFACVQDEEGKIFIYNSATERIEEVIDFGVPDDYEGIAVVGTTAYVVNSSGQITAIDNYRSKQISARSIATPLTAKHNIEGLCYDSTNNRLLLAVKDTDLTSADYKGIYAYDLTKKNFINDPIYKLELNHRLFADNVSKKKMTTAIYPSGISIHPITKEIYIVDGRKAQVLILNNKGQINSLITLSDPGFSQPEGITFDSKGTLYISNEGVKNPGNILKVRLN